MTATAPIAVSLDESAVDTLVRIMRATLHHECDLRRVGLTAIAAGLYTLSRVFLVARVNLHLTITLTHSYIETDHQRSAGCSEPGERRRRLVTKNLGVNSSRDS
ncbi:hypothetical protein FOIG_12976 [Fusarium odoratissimum NRRL 54006]|uniref:Uncharacterized protein n=2 Tax=Fusarium oxysporum species complex TaxID=171631 RepID=X0IYK1_FUSO5|nr:uncharacterized protein FOIG_12976 [Fusarium odoratissimum NRRL 54006]EXL94048.1 hypothetical protein FOIG_12976 [Fusarium odoratissimum NRRL 54006]TXC05973.1 hypothetical protein FocTR4_00010337 [Fusarium oxysporum f. sp. cubense]